MGYIESGEKGGGAVTDVAVREAFDISEPEGQQRLGPLQRLRLALLVEDHRVVGRVEVEADVVADILAEERISGELEVLLPVKRCSAQARGLGKPL